MRSFRQGVCPPRKMIVQAVLCTRKKRTCSPDKVVLAGTAELVAEGIKGVSRRPGEIRCISRMAVQ